MNLLLAAILGLEAFYIGWEVKLGTTCGQLGVDFCDYWSAGKLANSDGYASMYDLPMLYEVEKSIFPSGLDPAHFPVVPFLYLPVFVLPFQLLAMAPPAVALWLWNAFSMVSCWLYLRFFSERMCAAVPPTRSMIMLFVSLPVFLNTFAGQVSGWLVVCMGEFLRTSRERRPFVAGLWLAGMLVKPQVLVLLLLVLVLHRSLRALAGFAVGGAGLALASVGIVGLQGMARMLQLWITYADDQAHIWIEGMMNWRMLAFHLTPVTGAAVAYGLALAGMVVTLVLVVLAWRRPFEMGSQWAAIPILGILAATTMFSWHSQINTAMIMLPPLLLLVSNKTLPQRSFHAWVFLPTRAFLAIVFAPGLFAVAGLRPTDGSRWLLVLFAGVEFAANAALFWWAVKQGAATR